MRWNRRSQVASSSAITRLLHARASELIALADEHGFAGYRAKATIYLGWVMAHEGELERGLELVRDGLAKFRSSSTSSRLRRSSPTSWPSCWA